jgi:hypothetical protein
MTLNSLFSEALGGVQIEPMQGEIEKQLDLCFEEADGTYNLTRDTVSALLDEHKEPQLTIHVEYGVPMDLDTLIDAVVHQHLPNEPSKQRQSNMLAAKRSRLRKTLKLKTLQLLIRRLETKNYALKRENKALKQQLFAK